MPRRLPLAARSRGLQAAVIPLVTAALLAGCTAGPSTRPEVVQNDGPPPKAPSSAQQVPLPPLVAPTRSTLEWADCGDETHARLGEPAVDPSLKFSCARMSSPLDSPDLPGRGLTRVSLLKVGTGPVPLAVLNDIDGEPGTLYAARLAATLPPELLQKFSLVGVDRRGSGQSSPIGCVSKDVRSVLLGHDPADPNEDPVLDAARKAGQQCSIELDTEQQALDTWRTAGDLEELRDELGLTKLNAIARGEGSKVLGAYAVRYAGRVGRFVLDGIPDPSEDRAAVLDGMAAAAQSTLDAFGADCVARGCPVGGNAAAAVTGLLDQLRGAPPVLDSGDRFGPGLALRAVLTGLADRAKWPELAGAIAAAKAGDPAKLAAFTDRQLNGSALQPARLDAALATTCNDTKTRLPADRIGTVTTALRQKYPLFGPLMAQELAWCSPWPTRSEPPPPAGAPGAPPILVTSTAADPVTPEQGTIHATQQMPSAVRVAWQGAGHGSLGSPCVLSAVRGFLVDGKVPTDGTLCPA